jgi:FkbH-like protein
VLVADPDRRFTDVPLLRRRTIAVAATFTAEPVVQSLAFWLKQLDLPMRVTFAPYNQVFQQLLDPAGLLGSNHDGVNVLLVRFEDWLRFDNTTNGETQIERNLHDLIRMVQAAAARSATPYLICVGPASPGADPQRQALFTRLEALLARELGPVTGVYVVTSDELAASYPVADYYDPHTDAVGHVPFTLAGFAALGTLLARKISTLLSAPYKVIVLDADQTLWKGVCGEDGPQGVVIDAPRRALQEFMVAQHDAGMLLCLCSKNAEEDVAAVFEFHREMPLQRHHFVAWAVDWRAKSENIRRLADELQLGRDSFIFIDDNPIECAEVRAACPEMLVLQLPQDPEHIPAFLRHTWAFDHLKLTREDRQRTALYQQNRERERARREAPRLADFLASLDLSVSITTLRPEQHARVAQLTQRTNQLNATTIRRTEGELRQLELVGKECLCVKVSDRFGDYGLVGVITFETTAAAIEVDTFLLSCRVLGRGVKHRMLAHLAEIAQTRGLERVDLHYIPSAKNQPVANFLNWVGEQYRQPAGTGAIYQIPVAVAAAAPGRLLAEPAPASPLPAEKSARVQPSAAAPWRAARQARLAAALHTPDQILAMIAGPRRLRAGARQARPFVAPRSEAEMLLAGMWSKALHLDQVGIYDNFFDLGGHSLLATQIISQVQQSFEVALSLQNFFEAPTVARMTERIELLRRLGQEVQAPPIRPVARDASITTELPLSFAQQRLWFISQLEPDSPAYNIPQAVRLYGRLDVAALERALSEIVRRHEALRTTFAVVDGQPVARVGGQPAAPALPIIDLGARPGAGREAEAGRIVEREIQRPFDLARGPLLRTTLLRLGEREHILVLTMHHIVTDAWSLGVFVQELATLYESFAHGRPSPLPELPIQYTDFATWQQQWLQGDVLERQLIYWKQQLSGAPPVLELPADRPRPPLQTFRGAYQPLALPRALADKLLALSQREQVTLFMTLLAAFDTLLYRYTGQTDIVVGTPIANRHHAELAGLIGFFANTLVLRTDLAGDPSFRELLHRVREITLGAYDHQDLPFERLVSELQPERDLSYNPLFQVMFVFQNAPLPDLALSELTLSQVDSEGESTRFDLVFHLWEAPEGIGGILTYSTDLFDAATIEQMLKRFETLLEGIAANPEARISRLPLMSIEERQQAMRSATLVQPRKQLSEQLKHRLLQTVRSREA